MTMSKREQIQRLQEMLRQTMPLLEDLQSGWQSQKMYNSAKLTLELMDDVLGY